MDTAKRTCQAVVIHCMDFRLRGYLRAWEDRTIRGGFDVISLAGGVETFPLVMQQIGISVRLHGPKEAHLINHEDCGAYGELGTFEKHKKDLRAAKTVILRHFPSLAVTLLYMKLNGEIIEVK